MSRNRRWAITWLVIASALGGCATRTTFERLSRARQLASDMSLQFTKGADAGNKAVMADATAAATAFVREADGAAQAVQASGDELQPLLRDLGYAEEGQLLEEFRKRFAEYRELDRRILDLAVEHSNLKAQRLSFGASVESADAMRDALRTVTTGTPEACRVRAEAATALEAVREIQALQAPHIAEPDDAGMTRLEARMAAAEKRARTALAALRPLVPPGSRPAAAAADAALDRFMARHAEIVVLSRRNTNVRSLALTLTDKGKQAAACEDRLRALRDALGKRGFTATR